MDKWWYTHKGLGCNDSSIPQFQQQFSLTAVEFRVKMMNYVTQKGVVLLTNSLCQSISDSIRGLCWNAKRFPTCKLESFVNRPLVRVWNFLLHNLLVNGGHPISLARVQTHPVGVMQIQCSGVIAWPIFNHTLTKYLLTCEGEIVGVFCEFITRFMSCCCHYSDTRTWYNDIEDHIIMTSDCTRPSLKCCLHTASVTWTRFQTKNQMKMHLERCGLAKINILAYFGVIADVNNVKNIYAHRGW